MHLARKRALPNPGLFQFVQVADQVCHIRRRVGLCIRAHPAQLLSKDFRLGLVGLHNQGNWALEHDLKAARNKSGSLVCWPGDSLMFDTPAATAWPRGRNTDRPAASLSTLNFRLWTACSANLGILANRISDGSH